MASLVKTDKISTTAGGAQEFTIPAADGTANQHLKTDGSGVLGWASAPSITGSTNTWIPTITGADALTGTANFTYDGSILDVKNSGTASSVKLYCESSNAHYQEIKAAPHSGSSNWTLTLPPTVPSSSGQVLSATTAGVASWVEAVGGKIGQVLVVEDATAQTLATATYTATGLSQVITPSASSSKILCVWTMMALLAGGGSGQGFSVQINRSISGGAATDIYTSSGSYDVYTDQSGCHGKGVWMHLDSPSTTSATTYLVKVSSMSGYSITLNTNNNQTQLLLMEVLA